MQSPGSSAACRTSPRTPNGLPAAGTLLFFYDDGQVDEVYVGPTDPGTRDGARVMYVPPGTPTAGGHAAAIQDAVENDIARMVPADVPFDDPRWDAEFTWQC